MELKSAPNPIDNAGPVKQVAANLFYGWGYNFYRDENKQRADDLLVRGKVSALIGEARAHLAGIESDYRKARLPPPSRAHPYPDPDVLAVLRTLHERMRALEAFETVIRNASVPERDRITQRHRNERETLAALVRADEALVEAVASLKDAVLRTAGAESARQDGVADALRASRAAWDDRESVLDTGRGRPGAAVAR